MDVLGPSNTSPKDSSKKIFYILAVSFTVIFTVLGVWLWQKQKDSSKTWSEANNVNAPEVIKTEIEKKQLPKSFPADFPEEVGARITQNYLAETKDKRFQATRVYESVLNLEDNKQKFKQYLLSQNWTIIAETDESTIKLITAKKDNQKIQIGISQNTLSQVVTVETTLVEFKN